MKAKELLHRIAHGRLEPLARAMCAALCRTEYIFLDIWLALTGNKLPDKQAVDAVRDNVTFIFKSFERQKMAKQLYKNIQRYFPGVRVIIADDSRSPLQMPPSDNLTVIQLPFNSGLSRGLNRALCEVQTPYLVRLDDDFLLTRSTRIEDQLDFLGAHDDVDLVGFGILTAPKCRSVKKTMEAYYAASYKKPLLIPKLTEIDSEHTVVAKVPNIFIARTEKIKALKWDDNIRMIDHNEFFLRAAGVLVSTVAKGSVIFHRHNTFNSGYAKYRNDYSGDIAYIREKYRRK